MMILSSSRNRRLQRISSSARALRWNEWDQWQPALGNGCGAANALVADIASLCDPERDPR
jgi:hypothetical protein